MLQVMVIAKNRDEKILVFIFLRFLIVVLIKKGDL